jgi:TPR repeat protein
MSTYRIKAVKKENLVVILLFIMNAVFINSCFADIYQHYYTNEVLVQKGKSINKITRLANQGDAQSQYDLGRLYAVGEGVDRDDYQSFVWIKKSAEQGYAKAQSQLGYLFQYGDGVEINSSEAIKWYRKSAEQGYAFGQWRLGLIYQDKKDYKNAFEWLTRASEQDLPRSFSYLGRYYVEGWDPVSVDYDKAYTLYLKGAQLGGDDEKKILAGHIYRVYGDDFSQTAELFTGFANKGGKTTQYLFAQMYDKGFAIKRDAEQALVWYKKSAAQGYAHAQYKLGFIYDIGRGVEKNPSAAIKWYSKAAEQGLSGAQYNLGLMYESGRGVDQDDQHAFLWFKKAAEQEYWDAQTKLSEMYYCGRGVKPSTHQALSLLFRRISAPGRYSVLGVLVNIPIDIIFFAYHYSKSYLTLRKQGCER